MKQRIYSGEWSKGLEPRVVVCGCFKLRRSSHERQLLSTCSFAVAVKLHAMNKSRKQYAPGNRALFSSGLKKVTEKGDWCWTGVTEIEYVRKLDWAQLFKTLFGPQDTLGCEYE